jgi:hypothetical protein
MCCILQFGCERFPSILSKAHRDRNAIPVT